MRRAPVVSPPLTESRWWRLRWSATRSSPLRTLLSFVIFSCLTCFASDRAAELAQRATDAMGGMEKIHALHSLVYRGEHGEGAHHSKATMTRMRPHYRLIGCTLAVCDSWGRIVEAYDGHRGWELNWPKQRLIRTVNKAELAMNCGAEFDLLFIDYKERGFTAEYLGPRRLLGRDLIGLQIDPKNGCQRMTYYFDPKTYLVTISRFDMNVHARGDTVDIGDVWSDYRDVNGVKLPFRGEGINVSTGQVLESSAWTSIEANTLADASMFQAPEVHPTPVTALVLRMLDEGAKVGPEKMMVLYADYRKGAATEDTEQDLTWLGYEFLKIDRFDLAMPVLAKVRDEHPRSSNAHDSLGDAYLQMGRRGDALREFSEAVELDPNATDTKKKLAMLQRAQTPTSVKQ